MAATVTLNTARDQFNANVRSEPESVAASGIRHSDGAEARSPMTTEEKPVRARTGFLSALLQALSAFCV